MFEYSIIIPTLNESAGIKKCLLALQGIRSQCQLIVVDGGSVDNTKELCLPLVDQFISSAKGRAIQMNLGAEQASTEVLIFLHADTYLPEGALQLMKKSLESEEQWGRFDMQLMGESPMLEVVSFMMNWRSRLSGIATGDQVMFMTQSVYTRVGGFPEISLMEDIAMSKRLKKISACACLSENVKSSGRRWEEFGVWRTIILMWSLRLRFFLGASPEYLAQRYREGKII